MGKKKGGAKNKLAKMSEEERARYLQHRADIEEEQRRRKQQLLCLYMKNKLKREEAFSRLNLAKINQEWRTILRQIKCKELQNEVIEVEKLFQDTLEQKNRIIQRLLSDLDEAEDMYSQLMQLHMENIERFMNIHDQRLNYFRAYFIREKDSILSSWNDELESYKAQRAKSQEKLECVYYGIDEVLKKESYEQNENHLRKIDEIQSEVTIKLEELTKSREEQLQSQWDEYQKVLNDYVEYIETFHAEYLDLRDRDDENTKLIRQHCYEIDKATNQINELKLIDEKNDEEYNFQINYLENMKMDLTKQFTNAKMNLEENLKMNKERFKTITFLKKTKQKCEAILNLAQTCHKLEDEKERILPFGSFENIIDGKLLWNLQQCSFKQKMMDLLSLFENFRIRVNNVQLDISCLKKEKTELSCENNKKRKLLKNYFVEMTLEAGTHMNAQNRIMNRPHSMKVEKIMHIDLSQEREQFTKKNKRPVTVACIEANYCNAIRTPEITKTKMLPLCRH